MTQPLEAKSNYSVTMNTCGTIVRVSPSNIQYTINLTLNLILLFILAQTLQPPIVSEYSQYLLDIAGYCYCLSRIKYGARVRF